MNKDEFVVYLPNVSKAKVKRTHVKYFGQVTKERIKKESKLFHGTNTIFLVDIGELWQMDAEGNVYNFKGKECVYKLKMEEGEIICHLGSYLIGGENGTVFEFTNCLPMYIDKKSEILKSTLEEKK